jgi:hypothetical protein
MLDRPILNLQPPHPAEFSFVVCNQRQPYRDCMRSDPQIVVSDRLALRFQLRPNRSVRFGGCFRQVREAPLTHETVLIARCPRKIRCRPSQLASRML